MTRKVYKSAMGKPVDLGSLLLQNENVRAVGNMNVNARGDVIDSNNRVIDQKNRQVQRQYRKQTNVNNILVPDDSLSAKVAHKEPSVHVEQDTFEDLITEEIEFESPVPSISTDPKPEDSSMRGGLAAAIARNREVKQELEKTRRQQQQQQGLKKI